MKTAALWTIHVLGAPLMACLVIVFLLWVCIHWIEDEWLTD